MKSVVHPWLTRGTMDKTSSPKSSFSVKQCQPLAALPFGINWMGFTRDGRRILGRDEVSQCDNWSWILGLEAAQFHRSECYEFCAVVVLSCLAHGESLAPPTKIRSSFSDCWCWFSSQCSVNLRKSECVWIPDRTLTFVWIPDRMLTFVWISDRVLTFVPIWDFQFQPASKELWQEKIC